jgi:hypothetical protein
MKTLCATLRPLSIVAAFVLLFCVLGSLMDRNYTNASLYLLGIVVACVVNVWLNAKYEKLTCAWEIK